MTYIFLIDFFSACIDILIKIQYNMKKTIYNKTKQLYNFITLHFKYLNFVL